MSSQSVSDKYKTALEKARTEHPDFDTLPTVDLAVFANVPVKSKVKANAPSQL